MPTTKTMESSLVFNVSGRAQRRPRTISRSRTIRKATVTILAPIAILSQISCRDFLTANVASPAFFVTGLSIPNTRVTGNAVLANSNDNLHHQNPTILRRTCRHSPQSHKRRKSQCLFESISFKDDKNSSTAVLKKATKKNTKSLSLAEDHNEKGLLMNPMEDFELETDAIGFDDEYKRGLLTIGFITFLFATNSPVLHWAFTSGETPPPVLLVNTAVSIVALVGLLLGGDTLEDTGSALPSENKENINNNDWLGGLELGVWKFLGTTANLFGLALTTASHGALLIQLTTLIVPTTRALVYKESIPTKLKLSIGLALSGVVCFANDPTGTPSLLGDSLCVVAAICYSAYDLRLYEYGKVVDAVKPLITTKIATQALLSIALLFLAPASLLSEGIASSSPWQESSDYLQALMASSDWLPVVTAMVWSGVAVNAVAPFLQVGGQQIVGPTKCQTIYASQPLWASVLAFLFLGERLGLEGIVGGSAFLVALALAATATGATETTGTNIEEVTIPSASNSTMLPRESTMISTDTSSSNATVSTIDFVADSSNYR